MLQGSAVNDQPKSWNTCPILLYKRSVLCPHSKITNIVNEVHKMKQLLLYLCKHIKNSNDSLAKLSNLYQRDLKRHVLADVLYLILLNIESKSLFISYRSWVFCLNWALVTANLLADNMLKLINISLVFSNLDNLQAEHKNRTSWMN